MSTATVSPAKSHAAGLIIGCGGKADGEKPKTCAVAPELDGSFDWLNGSLLENEGCFAPPRRQETRRHGGAGSQKPVHRVGYRQGLTDSRSVAQDRMWRLPAGAAQKEAR